MSQLIKPSIEWVLTTPKDAEALIDKAVVAGYEAHDQSPLWVIRAQYKGSLIPGKLAIKHHASYVPWGGKEIPVENIEVCCAIPERICWIQSRNGTILSNAIIGGNTALGEPLFIGRTYEQGSLTPGMVHPSHRSMYISFDGKEFRHKTFQILYSIHGHERREVVLL